MNNKKFSYQSIPLTDRIFEQLGFKIEEGVFGIRSFNLLCLDNRVFCVDDSLGYRWTGDSLKGGHGYLIKNVGDLSDKYKKVIGGDLDISGLKTEIRKRVYFDLNDK